MQLVSIIIPYYKKIKYIKKTINSILVQTYSKFEIILIHDDPNDLDFKYLSFLQKKDKRIRLLKNKNNIGAGFSRNKGINHAKGYYIAFCDADDTWKKDKLKKQISFMKKKKIDFSFTSYNQINTKGKKIKTILAPKKQGFDDLLKDCKVGLSTVILKKKIIKDKYPFIKLKTKEDLYLWIKLSKKNTLVGYDKVLSSWRKLDDSLSSNSFQKIKDGFTLYYKYLDFNFFQSIYFLLLLSINFVKKNIIK